MNGKYLLLINSLAFFLYSIACPSSLLHVILGGGCPVALHHKVAFSLSDTERSPLVSSYTMSGGTATKNEAAEYYRVRGRVMRLMSMSQEYFENLIKNVRRQSRPVCLVPIFGHANMRKQ